MPLRDERKYLLVVFVLLLAGCGASTDESSERARSDSSADSAKSPDETSLQETRRALCNGIRGFGPVSTNHSDEDAKAWEVAFEAAQPFLTDAGVGDDAFRDLAKSKVPVYTQDEDGSGPDSRPLQADSEIAPESTTVRMDLKCDDLDDQTPGASPSSGSSSQQMRKKLNTDNAEVEIEKGLKRQLNLSSVDVRCPDEVELHAGATFDCPVTAGEEKGTINVTQQDDQGNIRWSVDQKRMR